MQGGLQASAGLRQVYEVIDVGIRVDGGKVVQAWNLSIEKVIQTPLNGVLRGMTL